MVDRVADPAGSLINLFAQCHGRPCDVSKRAIFWCAFRVRLRRSWWRSRFRYGPGLADARAPAAFQAVPSRKHPVAWESVFRYPSRNVEAHGGTIVMERKVRMAGRHSGSRVRPIDQVGGCDMSEGVITTSSIDEEPVAQVAGLPFDHVRP